MGVKFNPVILVTLLLAGVSVPATAKLSEQPIEKLEWDHARWAWLEKKDIDERVVAKREILVRARRQEDRAQFEGTGFVKATCERVSRSATSYEKYRDVTGIFEKVDWDGKTLGLKFNVLGFRYDVKSEMESTPAALHSHVLEGFFRGTLGTLRFTPKNDGCLVELRARTAEGEGLGALTRVLAEQVMYKGAQRLRDHLERNP